MKPTYIAAGHYRYRGWTITRGGYLDTIDDRCDGWYVDHADSDILDRCGAGYRTLADAAEAIDEGTTGRTLYPDEVAND
jgi:hypothetical protein